MTKEAKILIGIAVVVVIAGVLLAIFANPQPQAPGEVVNSQNLVRSNNYMTGKQDAKVTIVEFGDYQCPACAAAHPIVKSVLEGYKDNPNVNFVFRHFPLDSIHPNAHISSEAAEAAGSQGKFWEMHDLLYQRQNEWSTLPDPLPTFESYATNLGLDVGKFKSEVASRRYADVISADQQDGTSATVNSTPTFFINGVKYDKVLQSEELKRIIEEQLAK
jgi:protein-disulfide isomerase